MIKSQRLWERLNSLFSIVMVLDSDLRIVGFSDTLHQHLPGVAEAPLLQDLFHVKRPASVTSFSDLSNNRQSLFLMITHEQDFAIRGQVMDLRADEGPYFCFVGFPWLSWLHSNRPDLKLSLGDFRAQDAQMDQLFYISTEKKMIEDLENLNSLLTTARECAESAQSEKDAFFAHISHEMRTPLNGVVSAMTLLKDQEISKQARDLIDLAEESSNNLMQVINYVLDISKMEQSQVPPDNMIFDLRDLVDSLVRVVNARALEKGLDLHSCFEDELPTTYLGDPSRIRQSLLNLLVNAINFTDQGKVTVRVGTASQDGMTLRIEVCDSGIGIAREDQSCIFEPFKTLPQDDSVVRNPSTGLGLNIVRRNIQFMGGSLGINSEPDAGSTFWLELPCPVASPDAASTAAKDEPSHDSLHFQGYVLLVDDNESNLMLGKMILESMGLQADTVTSGEAAVTRASEVSYDLILMDINMPGIDGFEATRQIRKHRDVAALPILALSAYTSSAEQESSVACGMNGYLIKPIEREQLAQSLSLWLAESGDEGGTSRHAVTGQGSPLVDQAVLGALASQIGHKNLMMVIEKFLSEAKTRWKALENAATNEEVSRQAHTLASTCRSFGLASVADKLSAIEQLARTGQPLDDACTLGDMGRELQEGTKALQAASRPYFMEQP